MLKKISIILVSLFFILEMNAQIISKHGLLINGSIGKISTNLSNLPDTRNNDISYKAGYSVGYRFRLNPGINPFFIDLDGNIGMRTWNSAYSKSLYEPPIYEASSQYYYISTLATLNYSLYRGLSIGLGLEPTYYFYQEGETSSKKFDIPLVVKTAYNFGKFEVQLGYKHGLTEVIKTDRIKSGKFRDVYMSVFVPF